MAPHALARSAGKPSPIPRGLLPVLVMPWVPLLDRRDAEIIRSVGRGRVQQDLLEGARPSTTRRVVDLRAGAA